MFGLIEYLLVYVQSLMLTEYLPFVKVAQLKAGSNNNNKKQCVLATVAYGL